ASIGHQPTVRLAPDFGHVRPLSHSVRSATTRHGAHSTRVPRLTTVPPLVKQPRDDRGLEEDHSTNRQKLRTILLPYSRFAKINLASGHQATFADAPALHFSPVKFLALQTRWLVP